MPLYDDIFNYAYKGLQKAGESAKGMTEMSGRYMKGQQTPQDTSELLSTVMNTMSAPAGTIRPEVWSKMQPEIKASLSRLANQAPEFFKKILQSPTDLIAFMRGSEPGLMGSLVTHRPPSPAIADLLKVGRDAPLSATMEIAPQAAKEVGTALHEGQHMLNFPRVQATDPADAATIGTLLNEVLPRPKGSLTQRLDQLRAPSQVLSRPAAGGAGYYKAGETQGDMLSRMSMDEALSYLSEQARGLTSMQPTPMVSKMASGLGVGPEMPTDIADALKQLGGWSGGQ